MEDAESTLLSSAGEDNSNSKLALADDGFEVVTLESDYQVQQLLYLLIRMLNTHMSFHIRSRFYYFHSCSIAVSF